MRDTLTLDGVISKTWFQMSWLPCLVEILLCTGRLWTLALQQMFWLHFLLFGLEVVCRLISLSMGFICFSWRFHSLGTCSVPHHWYKDYFKFKTSEIQQRQKEAFLDLLLADFWEMKVPWISSLGQSSWNGAEIYSSCSATNPQPPAMASPYLLSAEKF